jgi:starvation-inducible outer membrane lipoprotein
MKVKTRKSLLTAASAFLLMSCASAIENISITSPDEHLQCTLIHEKNQLSTSVTLNGSGVIQQPVIKS